MMVNFHTHPLKSAAETFAVLRLISVEAAFLSSYQAGEMDFIALQPESAPNSAAPPTAEFCHLAALEQVTAIGEVGLDRLNSKVPIPQQLENLKKFILLSETLRKPLVIHQVRALPEILSLHKLFRPRQNWLIHGFRGNVAELRQIIRKKIYISLNPLILEKNDLNAEIMALNFHYIGLETDCAPIKISDLYDRAAEKWQLAAAELELRMQENFADFRQRR
ncbi:MAG: TatD family hydrolase [Victivallaceae bacterium]